MTSNGGKKKQAVVEPTAELSDRQKALLRKATQFFLANLEDLHADGACEEITCQELGELDALLEKSGFADRDFDKSEDDDGEEKT